MIWFLCINDVFVVTSRNYKKLVRDNLSLLNIYLFIFTKNVQSTFIFILFYRTGITIFCFSNEHTRIFKLKIIFLFEYPNKHISNMTKMCLSWKMFLLFLISDICRPKVETLERTLNIIYLKEGNQICPEIWLVKISFYACQGKGLRRRKMMYVLRPLNTYNHLLQSIKCPY